MLGVAQKAKRKKRKGVDDVYVSQWGVFLVCGKGRSKDMASLSLPCVGFIR
jgi:hypothetical protein